MINNIITFFQGNWENILVIIGGIVALATTIVKITPTQKDDSFLQKVVNILEKLSLVNTKKNADIIENNK